MDLIEVEFRRGVYLPEIDVWLDPHQRKPHAFISHAHADHVARHKASICSATTKLLVEQRYGRRYAPTGYEFGERFELGEFWGELFPAGHILGSAQIYLERGDGASLIYTGDFKLREGVASEVPETKQADTLIMETTFGVPQYRMPASDEVLTNILRFVHEALENGATPMLGAYSLGKAQEVLIGLHQRAPELEFLLHKAADKMTRIYGDLGYDLPQWQVVGPESDSEGKVVIAPPNTFRSEPLRNVKNQATAMISGWGVDPRAKYRYRVDEVFPLSDHADYDDLIRYVEMVQPKQVLTLHGFADEFAADLRRRGWEAWSLTGENQLELF